MKRLAALAKKSALSLTLMTVLFLGLGFVNPQVVRADASGAPYVISTDRITISGVTLTVVTLSNGDHFYYIS